MQTESPKISVVMPAFNAERHIGNAIESVLQQTFVNFELIIVNDGSTDQSLSIAQSYQASDSRIRVLNRNINLGIGESRNQAIKLARAPLIALLDSDDVWHLEKLYIQYQFHTTHDCAFSCTSFWFGDKVIRAKPTVSYSNLLANNVVNTSSTMIDTRQIYLKFSHLKPSEDYKQWLDIVKHHTLHFIDQPLVTRTVFGGISDNKIQMAKQRWAIYRELECLPLYKSLYYFMRYALSGARKYWRVHQEN